MVDFLVDRKIVEAGRPERDGLAMWTQNGYQCGVTYGTRTANETHAQLAPS
jgi:hypothetical protein